MRTHSVAVGIVEKKVRGAAAWMARRATQITSVDICVSGVKATSLCPEQALFSPGFTLVHDDLKGCKAGTMVAPGDAAQ